MSDKTLKRIISQIKKYGLVDVFKTTDNFENWLSSLSFEQIDNFLGLNIEPKEVEKSKSILINNNIPSPSTILSLFSSYISYNLDA